ncbi:LysR family transcriptional regulator [Pendulispora brunnea]|uniref:LysR family transcriptional regulator n=1 Tax=Pendulispora brunnea TaxID=2905690 RepID=A0ABZ2JYA2_9BACT
MDDLHLLTVLAETGSLAAAARKLDVHHASAWRRLGALEQRLGVRLFDRGRHAYVPTPAGEEAVASARRAMGELDELERRLMGRDVRPTGIVRLTTTETLLRLLAPVLVKLRAKHPGIVLEVVTADAFFTLSRDADIALRPAVNAPEHLAARKLATIATAVYASHKYLERRARPPAEHDHDWLAPDDHLAHLGSARWIDAHVAPERIVFRASSIPALHAAARAGLGLAALPCYMGDADPRLERVLPPVAEMASTLWLLTHPDLRRTARVRAVLDLLAARLVRHRELLAGTLIKAPPSR